MNVLALWKNWIRPLAGITYFIIIMIAIPLCIIEVTNHEKDKHVKAWFGGGFFVLIAVPISLWEIINHIINYTQPHLQKYIIRIIWMVPIYALNAWFALRFKSAAIYLDTIRECYEAYVIYNFMAYLLSFLWSTHPQLDLVLRRKKQQKHIIPFCCLPFWPMGSNIIQNCKHGVLQYTLIRPLTTIIALICELNGKYDEGDFNFTSAWSYLVIVNNISQIWAMYCLVLFYQATKELLAPIKPIPKFLCVKFVIFFSFWQAVLIAALAKLNLIPETEFYGFNVKEVATALQDFCICIEMLIAAIAHYFSFSHKPFINPEAPQGDCCHSFWSMFDISDVKDDVVEHVNVIGNHMKKTVSGTFAGKSDDTESTPLLKESPSGGATTMDYTDSVQVTQADVHQNKYQAQPDALSSTSDWEVTSVDQWNTQSHVAKSTTSSMHNYLDISGSLDNQSIHSQGIEHSTDAETKRYIPPHYSNTNKDKPLGDSDLKTVNLQSDSVLRKAGSETVADDNSQEQSEQNKSLIDFGSNDTINEAGGADIKTDQNISSDKDSVHNDVDNQSDPGQTAEEGPKAAVGKAHDSSKSPNSDLNDESGNAVC